MKTLHKGIKISSMHHYRPLKLEILSESKDNKFKTSKMSIKNPGNSL